MLQRLLLIAEASVRVQTSAAGLSSFAAKHLEEYCRLITEDEVVYTKAGQKRLQDLQEKNLVLPIYSNKALRVQSSQQAAQLQQVAWGFNT